MENKMKSMRKPEDGYIKSSKQVQESKVGGKCGTQMQYEYKAQIQFESESKVQVLHIKSKIKVQFESKFEVPEVGCSARIKQ